MFAGQVFDGNDFEGNCTLRGGAGNDLMNAGIGVDTFVGGLGADTVEFSEDIATGVYDSGVGGGNRDVIADFNGAAGDKIDFRFIRDNLTFVGEEFDPGRERGRLRRDRRQHHPAREHRPRQPRPWTSRSSSRASISGSTRATSCSEQGRGGRRPVGRPAAAPV